MSLTSLHWGAYRPQVVNGKLQALQPVEWDKDPSPIGDSVAAAITSPVRILRPAVRRGFLEQADGCSELRGELRRSPSLKCRGRSHWIWSPVN